MKAPFIVNCALAVALIFVAAVLKLGSGEDVLSNPELTGVSRIRQMSPNVGLFSCLVPPQPENGRWDLHERFCNNNHNCDIPQGLVVQVGSHLVYSCYHIARLEGNENVYCTANGVWSEIPRCIRIKCKSLNSPSRMMIDRHSREELTGDVSTWTGIKILCRPGYTKDTIAFPFTHGEDNFCQANGMWEVEPMQCVQDCGLRPKPDTRLATNADISHMPWHASIYLSNENQKNFICGATIIRPNVLLTAALCVYDAKNERSIDSKQLFVMTGNTVIDYDSPMHDPEIVKKAAVKRVGMNCDFKGLKGNYKSDIALLELEEPFVLSSTLVPACLDLTNDSEKLLQPGVHGKSVGVARTAEGSSSGVLKTLTLPVISASQFHSEVREGLEDQVAISEDKFVAGSTKGSGICGSGLVFTKKNRWQVMGILSTGYKNVTEGGRACNKLSYSRYTRIAAHLVWIFENFNAPLYGVIVQFSCNRGFIGSGPIRSPDPSRDVLPKPENFLCLVPPQPENGGWLLRGHPCRNEMGCEIPQVTELKPGSLLVYSCAPGYRASGNTNVFCGSTGNWSAIPDCIPVQCDPLNSVSTTASCSRFREFINCDSRVPVETQAVVSCRVGYKKDSVFVATRRETVTCTETGRWQPDPIRCVPICGVAINPQTPFVIDGVPARVSDFPWHATLYMERTSSRGKSKDFQCGATIIQANLLLTAAHCVFDERTKTTVDPKKLFVMTGNIFRDWDFAGHDPRVVRKEQVKKVYMHSKYYGITGNYVTDIALLELEKPFNFSGILLPACLDVDGSSGQILEAGALGRIAGFGRTATGASSGILQTITVPYVPYNQCKTSKNAIENQYLISNDKFCAGYNNGTAVCDGDSGGGLVFRKNGLWYVMGIVSVGIGVDLNSGERTCDRYAYTLYTKVTTYMGWIQDVIANLAQYE